MKPKAFLALIAALSLAAALPQAFAQDTHSQPVKQSAGASDAQRLAQLEILLENLRQELKIPAYSAAVVKDQKVLWAKGFGYSDVEQKIPATEHTSYHLASLTKTFASTILMQLVQEGKVKLDDPVSKYGIHLESEGVIRVRHLLSHTSEGNPGERYRYNGNRFGELDKVVQKASGKSFAELLIANILDPLEMNETAPNVSTVVKTKSIVADPKAEEEVKAAVMQFMAGYNSSNVDSIERMLSPQFNSYPAEGGALTSLNLADLRNAFQGGFKVSLQASNLETAVYGDSALATCILTVTVTRPGGGTQAEDPKRVSYLWNKQNGSWKIVHTHQSNFTGTVVTEKHQQRFDSVKRTLAAPYVLDKAFNITRGQYPTHFSTSAGLMSSVLDMAKYDIAIDQNRFLTRETQQLAFTPATSTKGEKLPYGLGWFTQDYRGTRLIWHYGYWTANSSLIVKVPDRNITFIIMANADNLSRPTDLGSGDVLSSPVALAFLKTFIFPDLFKEPVPEINWRAPAGELRDQLKSATSKSYADLYIKQLLIQARIYSSVGKMADASELFRVYADTYSKSLPDELLKKTVIAKISEVQDDQDKTVEFELPRQQSVRIFATGEGQGGQMFDYGWIESADGGKVVWEMKESETKGAGGAGKNRLVDTVILLPAGKYRLRYKTDDSHSFDRWNSLPPAINFWGIAVYPNGE